MQRVRIGLTGLACVFLLVLLAAAFFGLTNDERKTGPLTAPSAPGPSAAGNVVETPREPLAELGVTPGFAGEAAADNRMDVPPPAAAALPAAAPPAAPSPHPVGVR